MKLVYTLRITHGCGLAIFSSLDTWCSTYSTYSSQNFTLNFLRRCLRHGGSLSNVHIINMS
uniref:Orf60 n=1 Tax=Picobiliphyte sp. MS584-11 TaxID=1157699 RepID=A0A2H4R8C3_9EUKA|nr:orf60 [Picobiliphyte sp. MS584-11]